MMGRANETVAPLSPPLPYSSLSGVALNLTLTLTLILAYCFEVAEGSDEAVEIVLLMLSPPT